MLDEAIKQTEKDLQTMLKRVNELSDIKDSDTGLFPPDLWDLADIVSPTDIEDISTVIKAYAKFSSTPRYVT